LNITSATEFNAGDERFIIDPLLLPAFVGEAAAPLLEEICVAVKEAAEIKNTVIIGKCRYVL
jgi:hypothetical protein